MIEYLQAVSLGQRVGQVSRHRGLAHAALATQHQDLRGGTHMTMVRCLQNG